MRKFNTEVKANNKLTAQIEGLKEEMHDLSWEHPFKSDVNTDYDSTVRVSTTFEKEKPRFVIEIGTEHDVWDMDNIGKEELLALKVLLNKMF